MGRQTLLRKPERRVRADLGDVSLEGLVKQLVRTANQTQTKQDHAVSMTGNGQFNVLLDLEVDGVRCLLTRSAPVSPRDTLTLSPREQEISRMVMKGYPNKTIAKVLEISVWTVGTHLRRIFAKLRVGTRAAMVAHLLDVGQGRSAP